MLKCIIIFNSHSNPPHFLSNLFGDKWDWTLCVSAEPRGCEMLIYDQHAQHLKGPSPSSQGYLQHRIANMLNCVFFLVCYVFFQTLVFTKCLVWKIFQYFQALFYSCSGKWLIIASGKGMKIYSGIVLRSANVKKKKLKKLNARTIQNRAAMVTSLQ